MPELQIIGAPQSNYVWTTRIACAEKGIDYTLVPARPHSPEVDAIHPFGKIPVMRHGDVALCESRAICGYIDRVFEGPPLLPLDPVAGALAEQWISIINTQFQPGAGPYLRAYFFPGTPGGAPDRDAIDAALPKITAQLKVVARQAASNAALAGSSFTLADMYMLPLLAYLAKLPESGELLAESKALSAYFERHKQRESFKATAPPPFPQPIAA